MNLLMHLLRADVRRFRYVLLAWLVLVAVATFVDAVGPAFASIRAQETIGIVRDLLHLSKTLLLVVLVVTVVQLHPPVGTDAFWLTRPIPPLVLLGAKSSLLWPAAVVLPALAQAIVMAAYGVTSSTLVLVTVQTMLSGTLWLVLLMAGAAITTNFARFALLCGGVIVALAVTIAVSLAITMATADFDVPHRITPATADGTSNLVFMLLTGAAGAFFLIVQYRNRSRGRALLAGAAGVAVAVTVSAMWDVPLVARPVRLPQWTQDEAAARPIVDWTTLKAVDAMSSFRERRVWRSVMANVRVEPLQPGWSAYAALDEGVFEPDGGVTLRSGGRGSYSSLSLVHGAGAIVHNVVKDLLGADRIAGVAKPGQESVQLLIVPQGEYPRTPSPRGRYEGHFYATLIEHEIEAILPVAPGTADRTTDFRFSIEGVSRSANTVALFGRESQARSSFQSRPQVERSFFLRNRERREAIGGFAEPLDRYRLLSGLMGGLVYAAGSDGTGFTLRAILLTFPAFPASETMPRLDEKWLSGAELVVVRSSLRGSIQRHVRADAIVLPAPEEGR